MLTRALARLVLAGVLVVGGVGSVRAQPAAPYAIDAIVSLTGPAAFAGKSEAEALHLYEAIANREGGIDGRPVHFALYDDQSSPAIAVQLATAVVAQHPAIVLGCTLAQTCSALAPLFAHGPVLLGFSPVLQPPPGSFVFAPMYPVEDGVAADLRYFLGNGWKRLAIISSTDSGGQGNDRATLAALRRPEFHEMRIVAFEHFNPGDLSVAAQVARIKAAGPQALMVWASGTSFGTVLRGLADAAFDVPMMTTGANMVAEQLAGYGKTLPHDLLFTGDSLLNGDRSSDDPLRAPIDEFLSAFASSSVKPNATAGAAWDPARLAVMVLRKLGPNATAAQAHAYIAALHGFVGAGGIYDFRSGNQHGLGQNSVLVVRWDEARGTYAVVSRQGGAPL